MPVVIQKDIRLESITEPRYSVIITGGGSGIGAATAKRVVAGGGHVGIIDLNTEMANALKIELGERAIAVHADVLDEHQLMAAHETLERKLPTIVGLVNCAGIPQAPKSIENYPTEEWWAVVGSHLKGTLISCREFGSAMAVRGGGAVVNLASVMSFRPGPLLAYAPAKAGIVSLTQVLGVQWANRSVRVNAVAPGWTNTPFLRSGDRNGVRDLTPIIAATPMGRLIEPEEVAEVIQFLLSSSSSAITGTTVPCDGGFMAGCGWAPYNSFADAME
jgi:NAD(P)-dependent dehydrogenase (short-subunit alcohol dehydrogenase family)